MDYIAYQQRLRETIARRETAFSDQEYDRRRAALDRKLDRAGFDALLITQPADIYYLTGYNTFEVSVHTALVYQPGRLVLQVPSIETGPAVATALCDEILAYRWEGPGEIVEPLADTLAGMGGRIGVDSWGAGLRHGVVAGLRQRLPEHEFSDASALIATVKRVKSEAELECLRASARMTEAGIFAAADAVETGVRDSDVASAAAAAMHTAGSEFMSMQPIVVVGQRSSIIHTNHRRFSIAEGDPVFIEVGAAYQRYTAPLMHTVVAGKHAVTDDMERIAAAGRSIYQALIDAMVPGNTFDDAAQVAEAALARVSDEVFFSGVFGYTVGAQFPPSWVEGSGFIARGESSPFEENMVFHLPLCLRVPGRWGIGFSETVRVGARGGEALTRNSWELHGQ